MNKSDLTKQLNLLGLDDKEAQIYLTLIKHVELTPLELSRLTQINRSTIYRILDRLKELGLVEEILDQHRIKAKAVSPENLKLLIARKEAKVKELKDKLPEIVSQLSAIKDRPSSSTKVVYFRGKKGLQQMLWNVLKTKSEFVGYGYGDWNKGVGKEFADKLRQERVKRKVYSREIQNPGSAEEMNFTQVKGYFKVYKLGVIPKSVLEINHDTYIYNDVFAFYNYYKGELFGIEIHNKEITKTQRQIFEVLWKMTKKVNII